MARQLAIRNGAVETIERLLDSVFPEIATAKSKILEMEL